MALQETSWAALRNAETHVGRLIRLHERVGSDGLTDDEAGARLGCAWSTAGASRHALNRAMGREVFVKTERRRPTRSGRPAIVWVMERVTDTEKGMVEQGALF